MHVGHVGDRQRDDLRRRSSGSSGVASSSLARATMFASIRAARSPASAACVARSARSKRSRAFGGGDGEEAARRGRRRTWTMCWAANRPWSTGPSAIASDDGERGDRDAVARADARVGGEQRAEDQQRDQDRAAGR